MGEDGEEGKANSTDIVCHFRTSLPLNRRCAIAEFLLTGVAVLTNRCDLVAADHVEITFDKEKSQCEKTKCVRKR